MELIPYDRKIVAENIFFYRMAVLHMKQSEVAKAVGYATQTVSKIETAQQDASIGFLFAFAQLACVTIDKLVGLEMETVVVNGLTKEQRLDIDRRAKQYQNENRKKGLV